MSGQKRLNPNSARYWWPRIKNAEETLQANLPETRFIEFDTREAIRIIDGEDGDFPWQKVREAAEDIGYPVFVRTDLASAKHRGMSHLCAETRDELQQTVLDTFNWNLYNGLFANTVMLREFIDLEWKFHAFDGTRIAREYRVFASPEDTQCGHFYWPEDSINQPDTEDWRESLEYLDQLTHEDRALIEHDARVAAPACGDGTWSVDFAMDWLGGWWLIDMARAEDSWHPDDCPFVKVADLGGESGD